ALTTATNLLEQFVIAQLSEQLGSANCFLFMASCRSMRFIASGPVRTVGVTTPGYRCAYEIAKGAFQHALRANPFRRVGKNLRATLPADSDNPNHCRVVRARSFVYSVKFSHTLRLQHGNEMVQFVFDISGCRNGVGDLLSQQRLIALAKSVERLPERIF